MGTGSFPEVKWPELDADRSPLLVPWSRTNRENTSTHPLGLRGLFWGELYLLYALVKEDGTEQKGQYLVLAACSVAPLFRE